MIWILIGMSGAGKSTVGRILSAEVGCPLVDIDESIEQSESRSITAIFETDGEEHFRRLECEALTDVLADVMPDVTAVEQASSDSVIVTGGGAVTTAAGRDILRSSRDEGRCAVIWLDARPETVAGRIDAADRPLLAGATGDDVLRRVAQLSEQRRGWYEDCASVRVDCDDLAASDVAARILLLAPPTAPTPGRSPSA